MTVSGSFLLLRINVIVSCDFFAVFEVDSRNAGTDAAEDLVIYCAVKGSKFIGCDGLISVGADNGDHLADFYIVHIAKVYHKLIHTNSSDYMRSLSVYDHLSFSGICSHISVGIAYRNSCKFSFVF